MSGRRRRVCLQLHRLLDFRINMYFLDSIKGGLSSALYRVVHDGILNDVPLFHDLIQRSQVCVCSLLLYYQSMEMIGVVTRVIIRGCFRLSEKYLDGKMEKSESVLKSLLGRNDLVVNSPRVYSDACMLVFKMA
jgi:hypothetical protein